MGWRIVESSIVMAGLCWLLVRMWTDTPYEPREDRKAEREQGRRWRWLGRTVARSKIDLGQAPGSGSKSANTNPSRSTTSPPRTRTGSANIGPS